jgi:hypothetical protein
MTYTYCCVYSARAPDDGQRNCPKRVEFYSKNKFEKLVHLVGFITRIYHDARSSECQISWFDSRQRQDIFLFSGNSDALSVHTTPYKMSAGGRFHCKQSGDGARLITHTRLVVRLQLRGAALPLPPLPDKISWHEQEESNILSSHIVICC